MSKIQEFFIVQQDILDGKFMLTIRHKECGDVIGLVKGLLSKQVRMNCFTCDEMLTGEDVNILIMPNTTKEADGS